MDRFGAAHIWHEEEEEEFLDSNIIEYWGDWTPQPTVETKKSSRECMRHAAASSRKKIPTGTKFTGRCLCHPPMCIESPCGFGPHGGCLCWKKSQWTFGGVQQTPKSRPRPQVWIWHTRQLLTADWLTAALPPPHHAMLFEEAAVGLVVNRSDAFYSGGPFIMVSRRAGINGIIS